MITGTFSSNSPLIRKSKITTKEKGGIGKELSDGYALNYCVGCANGCPFCYVDEIVQRFHAKRLGLEGQQWGSYMLLREDLEDTIAHTRWERWKGKEVMLSSTHDPFHPEIYEHSLRILELALPAGVRFCIQTRELAVEKALPFIASYANQVRLQFSIATDYEQLRKKLEPRIHSTKARLVVLKRAVDMGIPTGVIIAPIMPPCDERRWVQDDLNRLAARLAIIRPNLIYAEAFHARGRNLDQVNRLFHTGWTTNTLKRWDPMAEEMFFKAMEKRNLHGVYWREHR